MITAAQPVRALEESARSRLIDSFLTPSHGDLAALGQMHRRAVEQDPILYGHLARWYQEKGSLRDHHELFCAHSLCSPFPEHRENGLVLLQLLRPYQVARVVRYCKEQLHYPTRMMRSAVQHFLRRREAWTEWFDECVIRDRQSMKYLYATLRIKPDPRAEQILFAEKAPADSRVSAVRRLFGLRDQPDHQARLIEQYHLHFTTARGAITNYTPAVLKALTGVMTPAQLITNLAFLEKRGALNHPELQTRVKAILERAVTESRVCDFKALVAMRKVALDGSLADRMLSMIGARLRNRGRITVPTALLVDKSGSMSECIEIGKLLAVLCSTIADADLFVEAFDALSFTVKPRQPGFAGWEEAFRRIQAAGATSIGAPLKKLAGQPVEQVVLISDGEENTRPHFAEEFLALQRRVGRPVKLVWIQVRVGSGCSLERDLLSAGIEFTPIRFSGDYYNLPNVIPLLCPAQQQGGLMQEVLDTPMFVREDLEKLPPGFDPETCEIL